MSSNIPHNPVPRILVVEDHPAELRVLADILENEAFAVSGATSAEKALQLVRAEQFAAAIVDLSLPDQSGIDLIREINRVDPHLRIIIHTGQASFETAKEAVNLHVFAYVEKLGDPGELVRYAHRAANDYLSEQLRQRELRYRTLYDRTPAMLSSIDLQGRLVGVSDYWLSKLGYRRDDVLGHRLSEFFAVLTRCTPPRVRRPAAAIRSCRHAGRRC